MAIERRIEHIRRKEAEARQRFGQQVELKQLTGRTPCTVCQLDPQYQTATNPNCLICSGKYWIPVFATHQRWVLVDWLTAEEKEEKGAGATQIGSCEITSDFADRAIWEDMVFNNTTLVVNDIEVRPTVVNFSSLRTKVKVTCERVKTK